MKQRVIGFDFARGLAIMGMIFVNFKVVMSNQTEGWLYEIMEIFSGKAAALFVVLAGLGMTLMYKSAKKKNDIRKIRQVKIGLLKRAAFLFVIGLSYYFIWPADILHYYGLYLSIGVLFLGLHRKWLIVLSVFIIIVYYYLFSILDYDQGWNWSTFEYTDFFTLKGFLRNLFFNGFHPVIPWIAFLFTGIWIGRIDFANLKTRKKVLWLSLLIYVIFKAASMFIASTLSLLSPSEAIEIEYAFGTSPMPPLFFYLITASSLAVFIITFSIYFTEKSANTLFVKMLVSTGQLALTNYVFHVVIGMFGLYAVFGILRQAFSIEFVVSYALMFNALTMVFSYYWRKRFERGPLELIMRKITG